MSTYAERQAEYERRKASGSSHKLDFKIPEMTDILGTMLDGANKANPSYLARAGIEKLAEIPEVQDVINGMKANLAASPQYGGVGKNLGEDVLYDKVDAITGEQRNSPNVVNIPGIPEGVSTQAVQGVSDGIEAVAGMGTPTAADLQPVDIMGVRREGAPVPESQPAAKAMESKAIVQQMKNTAIEGGATEEEVGFMERLGGEFDMMTVGLALMASNDGSGNFGANLGKALMLGRAAKREQDAMDAAAAADGREEGRKEREVAVKEANAETSRMSEVRQSRIGTKPTDKHTAVANAWLTDNPDFALANPDVNTDNLTNILAANLAEFEQLQAGLPPEQRLPPEVALRKLTEYSLSEIAFKKQSTFFGLGKDEYGI